MTLNYELGMIWKESAFIFNVLYQHCLGTPVKTTAGLSQNIESVGKESKPGPPEHEAGGLATTMQCLD